ncbi:MAG TPA: hypothetical protein DEV87_02780 [Clostridiales bacterium]|nr:hypothetical protein [Clostridiales bacterium]
MKSSDRNILSLIAFIALIVVAVLGVFEILAHFNVLTAQGALLNLLSTIKNICILIVVGITSYSFVSNKGKGLKITYWVAFSIIIACTVLIWIG